MARKQQTFVVPDTFFFDHVGFSISSALGKKQADFVKEQLEGTGLSEEKLIEAHKLILSQHDNKGVSAESTATQPGNVGDQLHTGNTGTVGGSKRTTNVPGTPK